MNRPAFEDLDRTVGSARITDGHQLLEWIPLAARLAALGDHSHLARWQLLARPFEERLRDLLVERALEGVVALREMRGARLADAIIAAQDFHCFLQLQGQHVPAASRVTLENWIYEADQMPMDEEAAEALKSYLREYPVPEDYRLLSVHAPLTTAEVGLIAALKPSSRKAQEVTWGRQFDLESLPATAATGSPPEQVLEEYEVLQQLVDSEVAGPLFVTRQLTEEWRVNVRVERASDHCPPPIEILRVGHCPAQRDRDDGRWWSLDMKPLSILDRYATLNAPVVIRFTNGHNLRISDEHN